MLTKQDIEEYQVIYLKVYGEQITYEEAMEQGARLLNLFKILYYPKRQLIIVKNKEK